MVRFKVDVLSWQTNFEYSVEPYWIHLHPEQMVLAIVSAIRNNRYVTGTTYVVYKTLLQSTTTRNKSFWRQHNDIQTWSDK